MQSCPEVIKGMVQSIVQATDRIVDRRAGEDPYASAFDICFFCAYGMHRSPASCMLVAERLKKLGYNVRVSYSTPPAQLRPLRSDIEATKQSSIKDRIRISGT